MEKRRETWVDNVKVVACIFVVLGHFFQSMTLSNIIPANDLYHWFNQTVYLFHVPLFFICSGYLYQKLSRVENIASWGNNTLKKAISLGIPYITFSTVTWILKEIFSVSVNNENNENLLSSLLFHPTSPYWFLYTLFFIFLITPTFKNIKSAIFAFVIAFVGKVVVFPLCSEINIYAISSVLQNEIWFIIGMCLNILSIKPNKKSISEGIGTAIIFIVASIITFYYKANSDLLTFLLGLVACIAVISIAAGADTVKTQSKLFDFLSKYTMPIFLLHTMFAAGFRSVLLKYGIKNAAIHIILGIIISFAGPILVAIIMQKTKFLEFFLYPRKFIKIKE